MKKMQKQKGFTLIELIIVIIILGILAVTAAPKFLDISSDASGSTLSGVKGALEAASQLARAKGRIDGINSDDEFDGSDDETVTIDGVTVTLDEGFAAPFAVNIDSILDIDAATARATASTAITNDFLMLQDNATDNAASIVRIYPVDKIGTAQDSAYDDGDDCYVEYTYVAGSGNPPTVTVTSTGC